MIIISKPPYSKVTVRYPGIAVFVDE